MRDVVVLLPGLTGSVLSRRGQDLWGPSAGAIIRAALGGGLSPLVLREDPLDRDDAGDGIVATRLFPDVHLIPGVWKVDGYSRVVRRLRGAFALETGRNYFEFPYDWRRDARVAARRLAREAHGWLRRWRESSGARDARLVLVAHSLGGLVARAYLELFDGWRTTRALVAFGTPFRGSPNALEALVSGVRKGPLGLVDLTTLARSCTSLHQLLPSYPVIDPGDGRLVRVTEAGLAGLDPARAAAGLAFHEQVLRAAEARIATGREPRPVVFPVVGIGQPTPQSARLVGGRLELLETLAGQDLSGDGTVPRISATPVEHGQERREMFAGTRHSSLQAAEATLTHLVGLLADLRLDLGAFRGPAPGTPLGLVVDDLCWSDEPVLVRARAAQGRARLVASARATVGGAVRRRASLRPDADGWHRAELRPLPPGSYRVSVSGVKGADPVEDVLVVARRVPA
jgi:hypothetical protein